MIKSQQKDLYTKWSIYGPQKQKEMIDEYISNSDRETCSKDKFLNFLKDKLNTVGSLEKTAELKH